MDYKMSVEKGNGQVHSRD